MISKIVDGLQLELFSSREELGQKAAADIEAKILELLKEKERVRMIFASAPSQDDVLRELRKKESIDWSRITAFHMDEYIGLEEGDSRLFSAYIVKQLFLPVGLTDYHLINSANQPEAECRRYGGLISEADIDIVCMGIGENGHIAFNEPGSISFVYFNHTVY